MELRVLEYFMAVAREQSILGAAESLHLTQPTLSRQLKDMEEELGKQLFIRSNRKITLTEDGMILRKRAQEILELVKMTKDEISLSEESVAGDIHIGAGETEGIRFFAKAAKAFQNDYPLVHFHIMSGDKTTVTEQLDRGLLDFGLLFGDIDKSKYNSMRIPNNDKFGVLMRFDDPLAQKEELDIEDIIDKPLIISRQTIHDNELSNIFKCEPEKLNIAATYSLLYNGSIMAEEGMGYVIGFDGIINTTGNSRLRFRPLKNQAEISLRIVWKKYQVFTKAAEKFPEYMRKVCGDEQ